MQFTEADVDFAARCPGVDRRAVRAALRDEDSDGLGWVQLVAIGASLLMQQQQKKKAKKAAKKAEAEAKAEEARLAQEAAVAQKQRQAMLAQAAVQQQQALQIQRVQSQKLAIGQRAMVSPSRPMRAFSGGDGPRKSMGPWLAVGGAAALALVFVLRR